MKKLSVQEAQGQLGQLIAEVNRGDVITLMAGEYVDPEQDSPELEAELLKSIDGPYSPYFSEEMRAIVERIIREEKRG